MVRGDRSWSEAPKDASVSQLLITAFGKRQADLPDVAVIADDE